MSLYSYKTSDLYNNSYRALIKVLLSYRKRRTMAVCVLSQLFLFFGLPLSSDAN